MSDELAEQVAGVGALMEPARRALYLYVAAQPDAVSREQAANAVDLPLHSVKFHLDRLLEEGLLEVEFRRVSGRTGPGAGRPSKLYRRSSRQLLVSLP
ncbi:MAG TPA: helix-turn-helix domain-containing protein, partial [Micromonosporaceae bacterium]